ncbi:hypothetical protein ABT075_30660 [Streptomyces sp. NPDC002677]|uniref:hypothetical protein n=1 Tax=Streptomyces sp. NPDC002677 TaxID=3154774 RepID=UPI00331F4A0A
MIGVNGLGVVVGEAVEILLDILDEVFQRAVLRLLRFEKGVQRRLDRFVGGRAVHRSAPEAEEGGVRAGELGEEVPDATGLHVEERPERHFVAVPDERRPQFS